jgi:hypothetical protein
MKVWAAAQPRSGGVDDDLIYPYATQFDWIRHPRERLWRWRFMRVVCRWDGNEPAEDVQELDSKVPDGGDQVRNRRRGGAPIANALIGGHWHYAAR